MATRMNARAKDCSSVYTDIARAYAEQVVTGEILLARELARADVFLDLVDCADPIQRLIGQLSLIATLAPLRDRMIGASQ